MHSINGPFAPIGRMLLILAMTTLAAGCGRQPEQAATEQIEKSDLRILYVGTDPQLPITERFLMISSGNPTRAGELLRSRAGEFEAFLKQYFDTVQVVYADAYKEAMSTDYDVTIIDGYLPKSPDDGTPEVSDDGVRKQPQYLSREYSHATVMIGEPSAFIGQGRELKINHLCLCLDAHAHGMKLDHPIFHTPYEVQITYEDRTVPGNYKARYSGRDLGDTMPMWRTQTEGYHDGNGFPIGLVSTGYGFDNGIDAEWISSGHCDKGVNSMAIGRHANFFHWGFAAAPPYMTDSAKRAFINSIHYIAPFKGAAQITRKIKYMPLREYQREQQWTMTDRGWAAWQAYFEEGNRKSIEQKKKLQARKDAGETLNEIEQVILNMPARSEIRAWTIRHEPQMLKDKFGEDWAAYERYYAENMDYFYPVPSGRGLFQVAVDEDARALGIRNSRVELLEAAVGMLQEGKRAPMANRILARYTNESFQTAGEWAAWLQAHRDRLYFSEGDGYKFMVLPQQQAVTSGS